MAAVRRVYALKRVGHAGTLDPFASGLLLVFLGQGTRLVRFMAPLHKTYTGVIRLGIETDTLDSTGDVVSRCELPGSITSDLIAAVFESFLGTQQQVPPVFSAKKIDGVPAYRRARRGEDVQLEAAEVTIYRLEVTSVDGDEVSFVAEVGPGTYIRSIARDVGVKLGVGGHLTALRRIGIGGFSVDEAVLLEELDGPATLRPLAEAVSHLGHVPIDADQRSAVLHGKQVFPAAAQTRNESEHRVALTCDGVLVAIAEPVGDALQPRVVVGG